MASKLEDMANKVGDTVNNKVGDMARVTVSKVDTGVPVAAMEAEAVTMMPPAVSRRSLDLLQAPTPNYGNGLQPSTQIGVGPSHPKSFSKPL